MTYRGNTGVVKETGRKKGLVSIEWRIPNFLSLASTGGDNYNSHHFTTLFGEQWYFKIYPNGLTTRGSPDRCDLFLFRLRWDNRKNFTIAVGIRGVERVTNVEKVTQEFSRINCASCWIAFCWRSDLSDQEFKLMDGCTLVITLDMTCVESGDASIKAAPGAREDQIPTEENHCSAKLDASTQTAAEAREDTIPTEEKQTSGKQVASTQTAAEAREDTIPTEGKQSSGKQRGIEKVVEDIGKLLVSGEMSDVTIQVGDVEFKVHSAILFARCPALCVSLQHDSKEKQTRRIIVEDCKPDVFRDFLQYLYTGSVQSLTEENVFDLHRIADRYLADDLKQLCLGHVRVTMSVQTICDAVRLALTHDERELLEQAVDFASENIGSIIRTVEWQYFMHDHTTEANEILIKVLGPKS